MALVTYLFLFLLHAIIPVIKLVPNLSLHISCQIVLRNFKKFILIVTHAFVMLQPILDFLSLGGSILK